LNYEKKHLPPKLTLLEDMLLAPEKTLVVALGNITQATESDALARSLVYLYLSKGKVLDLIMTFIDLEVASSETDTIFRINSVVTRMFKFYSRIIGIEYLFKTLARYIAELEANSKQKRSENVMLHSSIEIEVDPYKMTEEEKEEMSVNQLQLMLIVQKLFNAIMKSAKDIPLPLLSICLHVKHLVAQKFVGKDLDYKAVSAFLFLRFICPALAAPHTYGLLPTPPSDSCQRQLVLLSKVLQNLANGTRFGRKEDYMAKMNDFIDSNIITLQKFYDSMQAPRNLSPEYFVPPTVVENSLAWLHSHISLNSKRLTQELHACKDFDDGAEVERNLTQLLEDMGPPAPKVKNAKT